MVSRIATVLMATLALAACGTHRATGALGEAALARYDELCKFLPPDMQSYWFSDWATHPVNGRAIAPQRIARAASDFQSPPHIPGVGKQVSVEVTDYGIGNQAAHEKQRDDTWIADVPVAGHPTWQVRRDSEEGQTWWQAFVDSRYEVSATSRPLLLRALERSGNRASQLAFVPDLSVLADNPSDVVFCRPRPQPTTPFGGPSPTSVLVAQVHPEERRLEVFAVSRQLQIEDYYGMHGDPVIEETVKQDRYYVFSMQFSEPASWHLHLVMLFGTHFAI
tara:strand:+ start:25402 stop:26235 length:834 start_codon:yes stop_codon:yes gene_type:complete